MSDEAFFQTWLSESPGDSTARLLFAEWLAAQGDDRADGYDWMAHHHKRPLFTTMFWKWWTTGGGGLSGLDEAFEKTLDGFVRRGESRSFHYRNRREAEEALCRAVRKWNRRTGVEVRGRSADGNPMKSIDGQGRAGQAEVQG
jgi:uncharacterized protein (TIGR02996 family)